MGYCVAREDGQLLLGREKASWVGKKSGAVLRKVSKNQKITCYEEVEDIGGAGDEEGGMRTGCEGGILRQVK